MNTGATVQTPFVAVTPDVRRSDHVSAVVLHAPNPSHQIKATIYAAKLLNVHRVIEIIPTIPFDRLLKPDSYAVPHDLVDLTHGEHLTFFIGKGYGFLPQHTPFCPDLRGALAQSVRQADPRCTTRCIFVALSGLDQREEAQSWGAHLGGVGVSPTAFLARELEICYVPLCVIGARSDIDAIIDQMLLNMPAERHCPCANAMRPTRERGLISDDWRTWLPDNQQGFTQ